MHLFKARPSALGKIMGNAKVKGELSAGCITYLKEWYAEQMYSDHEDIFSKYIDKGNASEIEAIDVCAERFGLGVLQKNETTYSNDWLIGTPDVVCNYIIDVKCSWDGKTFLEAITSPINTDYEWQLHGYMWLTDKQNAKLVYCLLDTPEWVNFGRDVYYSNPIEHRFYSFDIERCEDRIEQIKSKVIKCREWLDAYHSQVKSILGL